MGVRVAGGEGVIVGATTAVATGKETVGGIVGTLVGVGVAWESPHATKSMMEAATIQVDAGSFIFGFYSP